MAQVEVNCRYCSQTDGVVRNGKSPTGHQKYYCRHCQRSFRLAYIYKASQQGTAEKVVEMAMNGSGVRDTARVLGISTATVMKHLKNSSLRP